MRSFFEIVRTILLLAALFLLLRVVIPLLWLYVVEPYLIPEVSSPWGWILTILIVGGISFLLWLAGYFYDKRSEARFDDFMDNFLDEAWSTCKTESDVLAKYGEPRSYGRKYLYPYSLELAPEKKLEYENTFKVKFIFLFSFESSYTVWFSIDKDGKVERISDSRWSKPGRSRGAGLYS